MPAIDYSHMTPAEKLELIGEIWDSIEAENIHTTLDEGIKQGRDAFEVLAELTARYR